MKTVKFPEVRFCPVCGAHITQAELVPKYDPVVVFACPQCSQLLWRPGLEQDGPVFIFDPDADAEGI